MTRIVFAAVGDWLRGFFIELWEAVWHLLTWLVCLAPVAVFCLAAAMLWESHQNGPACIYRALPQADGALLLYRC
jgi:hypothetical protein